MKDTWKKLYEEGKNKDKYEQRALLRQMKRIEGDIAKNGKVGSEKEEQSMKAKQKRKYKSHNKFK